VVRCSLYKNKFYGGMEIMNYIELKAQLENEVKEVQTTIEEMKTTTIPNLKKDIKIVEGFKVSTIANELVRTTIQDSVDTQLDSLETQLTFAESVQKEKIELLKVTLEKLKRVEKMITEYGDLLSVPVSAEVVKDEEKKN
jgi:hypothetical protein